MQYRTKVIINGAELPDEQRENASSITSVTMTSSCGSGFQIGSTASSMLEFTVIKPYKESFDGDKVDFYVKPVEDENSVSILTTLEEQVGDSTATEHIEESEDEEDIETEETEDTDEDVEDVSEEEEAESEAEMDQLEMGIFDLMNGEDASNEEPTEDDSEETESGDGWDILGTFYVYKQTNNNDGTVTLQCYDGFQLMNDTYVPAQTKGTFQQFYDDVRSQCQEKGIIVDADTFEEDVYPDLEWNQVCTLREAIGYLAGLLGGFATFGDDNTLGISFFGYDDEVLLTSELLSSTSTSAGETMVDGVICTLNLNQDTIESGECGQPLCFYNPFMTQELLDNILEEYQGIRYTGAVVRTSWKPTLIPGEFTRLMTENEYMNYVAMQNALANSSGMSAAEIVNLKKEINAVGKSILVSTETVTFGGEAVAEIRSHLMTETEKANAPLSPSDAKFRVVTADLIKTKELVAEKANITDLNATNATIEDLKAADATITGKVTAAEGDIASIKTENADIRKMVAEKANITDLNATNATIEDLKAADATITGKVTAAEADINSVKADYVKASELDTKVATIANAEIGKATIKDAQIESINGNKIIDGSIVAAALSHEVVKNFRNNNIYYQAEAPEGDNLKEGDLWYKTLTKTSGDRAGILFVYDGSGWVNKPFDSESILAKSITAAEIATGTITSSQLAAHTITANEIEAGTITAKEMNMENLQTNIARVGDSAGKHLDILTDGIEIKDGTKQLAKYGDSVVIGDESATEVVIGDNGFKINKDGNKILEVTKKGIRVKDNNGFDIMTAGEARTIGGEGSTVNLICRILSMVQNADGTMSKSQPIQKPYFTGFNSETDSVIVAKYKPGTANSDAYYSIPLSWLTTTAAGTDGRGVDNVTVQLTSTAVNKLGIDSNTVVFVILQYVSTYIQDAIIAYNRNPTKIERISEYGGGMAGSAAWLTLDANFPVAIVGDAYVEGLMHNGAANLTYLSAKHVGDLKRGNLNYTAIQSGTGKATMETGAKEQEPQWRMCGNVAEIFIYMKAKGSVASGSNLATAKITGVPKPFGTNGVRGVSYYGDNAVVSFMSQSGGFTARNCGKDALASGNNCVLGLTYLTDGTFL